MTPPLLEDLFSKGKPTTASIGRNTRPSRSGPSDQTLPVQDLVTVPTNSEVPPQTCLCAMSKAPYT